LRETGLLDGLHGILPDLSYTEALVTFVIEVIGADGVLEILHSNGIGEPNPEETEP